MNLSVPKVKKCCFFFSLRNATKFFGWFYLVTGLFGLLGEVYQFAFFLVHSNNIWFKAIMLTDIMLTSLQSTSSFFLLIGVYQKEACYLFWWVISNCILTVLSIIGLTLLFFTIQVITSHTIIYLISNVVDIYSILVVYSYYYETSENLPV